MSGILNLAGIALDVIADAAEGSAAAVGEGQGVVAIGASKTLSTQIKVFGGGISEISAAANSNPYLAILATTIGIAAAAAGGAAVLGGLGASLAIFGIAIAEESIVSSIAAAVCNLAISNGTSYVVQKAAAAGLQLGSIIQQAASQGQNWYSGAAPISSDIAQNRSTWGTGAGNETYNTYNLNGTVIGSRTINTDNSSNITHYNVTGQGYSQDTKYYNSAAQLTQWVKILTNNGGILSDWYNVSNGTVNMENLYTGNLGIETSTEYNVTGQGYSQDTKYYNSGGQITQWVKILTNNGGIFSDWYNVSNGTVNMENLYTGNLAIETSTTYNISGQAYNQLEYWYNGSGQITKSLQNQTSGQFVVNFYNTSTGKINVKDIYNNNWAMSETLAYGTDGTWTDTNYDPLNQQQWAEIGTVHNADNSTSEQTIIYDDGHRTVQYYNNNAAITWSSDSKVYTPSGTISSDTFQNRDNTHFVLTYNGNNLVTLAHYNAQGAEFGWIQYNPYSGYANGGGGGENPLTSAGWIGGSVGSPYSDSGVAPLDSNYVNYIFDPNTVSDDGDVNTPLLYSLNSSGSYQWQSYGGEYGGGLSTSTDTYTSSPPVTL